MAKGVYIGVGNKARKVKAMYIGVGGKARKIVKGYIGVGGKARPFWSGGEDLNKKVEYYGTITPLANARFIHTSITIGNYALFGGGLDSNGALAVVDAYNSNLVRSSPTALSQARCNLSAQSIGNYALFVGGSLYML